MQGWGFLLRYGPWIGLTTLITVAGARNGTQIPQSWRTLWLIGTLFLLVLLEIFKEERPWNRILLLIVAYDFGKSLSILGQGVFSVEGFWILVLGGVLSWVWAYRWRRWFPWLGLFLGIGAIVFGVGWVLLWVFPFPVKVTALWAGLGLSIVFLSTVATLKDVRITEEAEQRFAIVIDLYILYFLMYTLGSMVMQIGWKKML